MLNRDRKNTDGTSTKIIINSITSIINSVFKKFGKRNQTNKENNINNDESGHPQNDNEGNKETETEDKAGLEQKRLFKIIHDPKNCTYCAISPTEQPCLLLLNKVYQALREGQSSWFCKTNKPNEKAIFDQNRYYYYIKPSRSQVAASFVLEILYGQEEADLKAMFIHLLNGTEPLDSNYEKVKEDNKEIEIAYMYCKLFKKIYSNAFYNSTWSIFNRSRLFAEKDSSWSHFFNFTLNKELGNISDQKLLEAIQHQPKKNKNSRTAKIVSALGGIDLVNSLITGYKAQNGTEQPCVLLLNKVYQALREGQSSWFCKTNKPNQKALYNEEDYYINPSRSQVAACFVKKLLSEQRGQSIINIFVKLLDKKLEAKNLSEDLTVNIFNIYCNLFKKIYSSAFYNSTWSIFNRSRLFAKKDSSWSHFFNLTLNERLYSIYNAELLETIQSHVQKNKNSRTAKIVSALGGIDLVNSLLLAYNSISEPSFELP